MNRQFNITGLCIPTYDYMVDINSRVEAVKEMVDQGQYFTVNKPRQYGKTTLLEALTQRISNEYICANISFEGLGDESFEHAAAFCKALMTKIQISLKESPAGYDKTYIDNWKNPAIDNFLLFDEHVSNMCLKKKVVLIIDEVDKTSDNRVFLHFLGFLRDKYLRRKKGLGSTFHSVILSGVYDIRNLKVKLIGEGVYTPSGQQGHLVNSPWNIAADFLVDMSFYPEDIVTMLEEYEADHTSGMDISRISEVLYEYTGGYPFLVSKICRMIDNNVSWGWTPQGVRSAVKSAVNQIPMNTLFDDISKNLENYLDIYNFIYDILIKGKRRDYTLSNPSIQRAAMFGLIKEVDGSAVIANRIFEIFITDYFTSKDALNRGHGQISGYKGEIIHNGYFDMEYCLTKFTELFREIYPDRERSFVEEHGRMLFLTYLKPLINGAGFYHIESQFTDQRRMDLVVDYGLDQFIIELKLWYGEAAHERAYDQLSGYIKSKGVTTGYLLTFDFRKNKNRTRETKWVEWNSTRIFDVMV